MKVSSFSESRVTRSREEVKATYDGMSGFYDLFFHLFEGRYINLGLRTLNPQRGERILEIGPGTGRGLCFLAERVGRGGRVYGLDLSEKMVRVARARLRVRGFAGEVEVRCGDAAHLPFETDFFEAIFMSFTLELFDTPEIPVILAECFRVCAPGGRICIVSLSKRSERSLLVRMYEWFHRNFEAYADCRPIFIRRNLENAGFKTKESLALSMYGLPLDIYLGVKGA